MNILPKKRWHVRTRENITRVRRDEAAAAEEERKRQQRLELAEKEARTELLKAKARGKYWVVDIPKKEDAEKAKDVEVPKGHINFFYELEENEKASNKTNADHEREAKEEREKEEMKIGYLTYLGQDTNELSGAVSWYNKLPERSESKPDEIDIKAKNLEDPLQGIRSYLDTPGIKKLAHNKSPEKHDLADKYLKKHKKAHKRKIKEKSKHKKSKKHRKSKSYSSSSEEDEKSSSKVDLAKLREERLRREKIERQRADEALARLRGESEKPKEVIPSPLVQKYNAQFNPHLARQNYV